MQNIPTIHKFPQFLVKVITPCSCDSKQKMEPLCRDDERRIMALDKELGENVLISCSEIGHIDYMIVISVDYICLYQAIMINRRPLLAVEFGGTMT